MISNNTTKSSRCQPSMVSSAATSNRDANLVDVLFSSALEGEFVRDQLSGTFKPHDYSKTEETDTDTTSPINVNKNKHPVSPQLKSKLQSLERQAIQAAETGNLTLALTRLTDILDTHPYYASAYNNRAQVYRLIGTMDKALQDLDKAIEHAQEESVLGQAYTQKAIMLRSKGDQDGAYYNFSMGARYGNHVAAVAAPKENPYAKLCGKMVSEAMRQLVVAPPKH
ncbi:hypothetical protein LPJ57_003260 [Coemansia sp. RSA 486]|nr:hypothetical protein LPJ57_003260 [Coemansia sp. RSA 486]KAJ2598847.1 hypothetical protein GGF39_002476 [Coemansia sp. RSA 1721]KAJ2636508.1 hypothetical protein GGF40_002966 [Coemansia sp. RSA 1286]